MKTSSYWKKRVELLEDANHNNATKYADEISRVYDSATRELEGQLTKWYTRYANEEGITLAEAKRLLNSRELEEFRMDVHDYIKKGRSLDPKWAKQLEGASVRVHISRLEALKVQTQQLAERTKGYVADTFDEFAVKTYSDQYYKTIFEVQKGAGIGFDITKLDEKQVRKVINKPWAVDGKNFSQRIWGDRTKLVNELHQTLSKGIIQGKAPQKMVKELSERMGVSKSATARLVYTESSFFANQATLDSYKELGVDRYEVLATLDKRTTPICQKMDGKTFGVNEMEVGVNYPPFHVYCRTTTVPFFDDEFDIQEERASRDENGDYYVLPASIKYPEWHEAFVNGGSKATLQLIDKKEVAKEKLDDFVSKVLVEKDEVSRLSDEFDAKDKEWSKANNDMFNAIQNGDMEKAKEVGASVATLYNEVAELRVKLENGIKKAGKEVLEEFKVKRVELSDAHTALTDEIRSVSAEIDDLMDEWKKANPQPSWKNERKAYMKWSKDRDAYEEQLKKEKLQPLLERRDEVRKQQSSIVKNIVKRVRPVGYKDAEKIKEHLEIEIDGNVREKEFIWKSILRAYRRYPTEWIEESISSPLKIISSRRGYYDPDTKTMALPWGHPEETAVHELGHRFEFVRGLKKYESIFYDRRTEGKPLVWLGHGYEEWEKYKDGGFIDKYIGKSYGGRAYEVVSMGFEYAFTEPSRLLEDEDYAQFILGLLVTR